MKTLFFCSLLFLAQTACSQEEPFLAILRSDAPLKEKADACQELARVGTRQSVPLLASLLADDPLSHRARSALETIADPSVEAALREALGKLKGPALAGVIHTLGVRKDTQAVAPLSAFLMGPDPALAREAARALGCIGSAGVPALEHALSTGSPDLQSALCEGLFRAAETMPGPQAAALYRKVQALPELPQHLRIAAWRGALRSLGASGVPRMLEAIRTGSPVSAADALHLSMELPGPEVTRALVGVLGELDEATQIRLLQTLGDRGDTTAAPALEVWARRGPPLQRIATLQCLVQLHQASSLPEVIALLEDAEQTVAEAALTGLIGWPGPEADPAMLALLNSSHRSTRIAALGAVGQRRISAALPTLLKAAGDAEVDVASAAFTALGELGGSAELPGVVNALLKTKALEEAELALNAICERQANPTTCAGSLTAGLDDATGEARLALLRTLGSLGGPQALNAMRQAAADPDKSVRETAWRALCEWPTAEAMPDLVRMTGPSADPNLRNLALRAQLRLIPLQPLPPARQAAQVQELLPAIEAMKQQHLALSTLGGIPCPEALELVTPFLGRTEFNNEASLAAVAIAEKIVAQHPAEVATVIPQIQTSDAALTTRARKVLAEVPAAAKEAGFTPIFNGRDLSGWDGKPGAWRIEEGALTAESTPENPCLAAHYLVWRGGEPSDFEMIADFRLSAAGNSGIQLRSRSLPDWDTSGYQADMSGDGSLVGFVYEHTRGLIAGRGERVSIGPDGTRQVQPLGDATDLLRGYRKEQWNTYRIVCRGPEIRLWINGTLMCHFVDHDAKQAASKGVIALQMHPGPPMRIQFKNLWLKTL